MFSRPFSAKETDEAFVVYMDGDPEPFEVAKYDLPPEIQDVIRANVVPDDAEGHFAGAVVANAVPPDAVLPEETVLSQAAQDDLAAQGLAPVTTYDPALVSSQPQPAPMSVGPLASEPPPGVDPFAGSLAPRSDAGIPLSTPDQPFVDPVVQAYMLSTPPAAMGKPTPGSTVVSAEKAPLSDEERAMAQRSMEARGKPGEFQSFVTPEGLAMRQGAGAGAGARQGGSVAASFASSRKGGMGPGLREEPMPEDPERQRILNEQIALAGLAGEAEQQRLAREAELRAKNEQDKQRINDEYISRAERYEANARQLADEVRNGRVDPNRLWNSMDGAQQATTMLSLLLGGIAQGMSGGRTGGAAEAALDRMIERDIQAQRENLQRKQTLIGTYMEMGHSEREAAALAKADLREGLAAQLDTLAAQFGSETAQQRAKGAILTLQQKAAAERADAANQWRTYQLNKADVQSKMAERYANAQFQSQSLALRAAEMAMAGAGAGAGGGKNPPMEIAPGVIVQPADPTSRQNLEKAVEAFNTMRNLVVEARAHRAEHGAQFVPRTKSYEKAEQLEKQLVTALNNIENLGAFDRGTADLLGKIVPKVGGVYAPGVVDSLLAGLLQDAEQKFRTKVMANVVPGTGLVSFSGPQGDFKPVGKAD